MTSHQGLAASPRIAPRPTSAASAPAGLPGTAFVATVARLIVALTIVLALAFGIVSAGLRDDPVGLVPTPSPGPAPIPMQTP